MYHMVTVVASGDQGWNHSAVNVPPSWVAHEGPNDCMSFQEHGVHSRSDRESPSSNGFPLVPLSGTDEFGRPSGTTKITSRETTNVLGDIVLCECAGSMPSIIVSLSETY